MTPSPIPDELWQPIIRRYARCKLLMQAGGWSCYGTALASWLVPIEAIWRWILPLTLCSLATGIWAMFAGRRNLQRARKLIIKYHGYDPGPPW